MALASETHKMGNCFRYPKPDNLDAFFMHFDELDRRQVQRYEQPCANMQNQRGAEQNYQVKMLNTFTLFKNKLLKLFKEVD